MKKIFVYIIFFFLIIGGVLIFLKENNYLVAPQTEKETLKAEITDVRTAEVNEESPTEIESEENLPKEFKLEVPFTSQAPLMKPPWPEDFNDACEEAAILIVDAYIKDRKLTAEIVKKEILEMINFQEERYPYDERNKDLEAEEVAKLARDFYGYKNTRVDYDISIEDIQREVVTGNPVILPAAGRKLGNPHYSGEGPLYHMLVAIGYNETEIITNDPGTKFGEGYRYKYNTLLNAVHEWNRGDVDNGRSAMIILQK